MQPGQFILALSFLFTTLLNFESALSYSGLENNYLAENWGMPLASFLTLIFGLGWWLEILVEKLALSQGRKPALFAYYGIVLIFALIMFSSLVFTPSGFLRYAISGCGYIFMSSFHFRFSAIHPETIAKLQKKN